MEDNLSPSRGDGKTMSQIQGALVGIAMVLSLRYLSRWPFGGSTGTYRQFLLLLFQQWRYPLWLVLILTPALCATLLKTRIC